MPKEKRFLKEFQRLNKSLRETGFVSGVETLLPMWIDKKEELIQFLASNGFDVLATKEGVDWLYKHHSHHD